MSKIEITAEMWHRILRKSPAAFPDNPSAVGWSAKEIKEALYRFVLDEKDSVRALIELLAESGVTEEEVKALIKEALEEFEPGGGGGGTGNDTATGVDESAVRAIINQVVPAWARASTKPTYTKGEVGLGNVDNAKQYSESNPPDYPVDSVNGKTGAVQLTASDVGADPSGTAATKVSDHDTYTGSHSDIRLFLQTLSNRLNAFLDTDDTTLDELSEIVAYIKSNKTLIDSITTSKVNVTDIINNLTTNVTNKPLSAAQGVALKKLIDALKGALLYDKEQELTEEQKSQARANIGAVTQADINAAISNVMPEFVDSVEEMTDQSKKYVLTTTGTVWQYDGTVTETEVSRTVTNNIVGTTDNPYQRGRLSSGGALSADVSTHTITPYIDLTKEEYIGKTIQLHLDGNRYVSESNETYIQFATYKTDKTVLTGRYATCLDKAYSVLPVITNVTTVINGTTSATLTITIPPAYNGTTIGYFRFCGLGTVTDSVYITYTDTETVTSVRGWYDTEVSFSGGGGGGGSTTPDIDVAEIAEQAAALVDANLLGMIGSGEVSV